MQRFPVKFQTRNLWITYQLVYFSLDLMAFRGSHNAQILLLRYRIVRVISGQCLPLCSQWKHIVKIGCYIIRSATLCIFPWWVNKRANTTVFGDILAYIYPEVEFLNEYWKFSLQIVRKLVYLIPCQVNITFLRKRCVIFPYKCIKWEIFHFMKECGTYAANIFGHVTSCAFLFV